VVVVCHRVEVPFEVVEARCPHLSIGREPGVDCAQRLRAHAVEATLSLTAHLDEARFAQDPQMLGDRRLAQLEFGDDLPGGTLGIAQQVEDLAAMGLCETAGWLNSSSATISPAGRSESPSRSRIWRRWGSARTPNTDTHLV